MKKIIWTRLSIENTAAAVCGYLRKNGIKATLVGGACVSIYTRRKYESYDLDFYSHESYARLAGVMEQLGFRSQGGRHLVHPQCRFYVEFVPGPLAVGSQPLNRFSSRRTPLGTLTLLCPTDICKDRLAAFFHWNDRQSLAQAVMIRQTNRVGMAEIRRWAKQEGPQAQAKLKEFEAGGRVKVEGPKMKRRYHLVKKIT
jgi:hypothetical protein